MATLALSASACASLNETYYVAAYDPASSAAPNYYRVSIVGRADGSKIKYSIGYYDREVIERLFGEFSVQREYADPDAVELDELEQQLHDAQFAGLETRVVLLREANARAAALLSELRMLELRRKLRPELESVVEVEFVRLEKLLGEASAALNTGEVSSGKAAEAMNKISEVEGGLSGIRDLLDDGVVVRFFDGAGNEIDTRNKVQVIFAATDVSQITSAFQNIQDIEKEKDDLVSLLTADQAKAANAARARVLESQQRVQDIHARLDSLLEKQDPSTADELRRRALEAAAALADGPASFGSANELDAYLKGKNP